MRILVTGASGFLGRRMVAELGRRRHAVLRLTRGPADPADPRLLSWDPAKGFPDEGALEGLDAVIHLAGEGIADRRWTEDHLMRVRESRIQGTRTLLDALARRQAKPKILLAASAVGIYGDRGEEDLPESARPGSGILASLCVDWEAEAARAHDFGLRVVHLRFGTVLAPDGGALRRMLLPFTLGLGGRLGSGKQWMSWISASDAVRAMIFLLERDASSGAYNLCAPNPVTNAQFTQSLRRALSRPALIPIPGFALRLFLGAMVDEVLLASQKAQPARLRAEGFTWGVPYIGEALNQLIAS